MNSEFAANMNEEISQEYRSSGHSIGWRFLYSPASVLDGAKVALIGLNPGGSIDDPTHAKFAMVSGSAYRDEIWPDSSKLQSQVLALFARLGVEPEDVLAGNLVPFRSKDWQSLNDQQSALIFGCSLWQRVLQRAKPSLIVTMGKEPNSKVSQLMNVKNISSFLVGWGNYTAARGTFAGGEWVGLPHLSRFAVMKRPESQQYLDQLFDGLKID